MPRRNSLLLRLRDQLRYSYYIDGDMADQQQRADAERAARAAELAQQNADNLGIFIEAFQAVGRQQQILQGLVEAQQRRDDVAATAASAPAAAPTGLGQSTRSATSLDPTQRLPAIGDHKTDHETHLPSRADTTDFLRSERPLVNYMNNHRLEPYGKSIEYQFNELMDLVLTPLFDEPRNWMSFEAYTRQSNAIEEQVRRDFDRYLRQHPNHGNAGQGTNIKICYKSRPKILGPTAHAEYLRIRSDVTARLDHEHPVQRHLVQDMLIPHPHGVILYDNNGFRRLQDRTTKQEVNPLRLDADGEPLRRYKVTQLPAYPVLYENGAVQRRTKAAIKDVGGNVIVPKGERVYPGDDTQTGDVLYDNLTLVEDIPDPDFNDASKVEYTPNDDSNTENVIQLISNDPTQYPYLGDFAVGRALDRHAYRARDLALSSLLVKFTEQAHLGRPELKVYDELHNLDLVYSDSLTYDVMRIVKDAYPESTSDRAQQLYAQYEGIMYPMDYYFTDFISLLLEINAELTKVGSGFRYDDRRIFAKVKVIMRAVFVTDSRGDPLHTSYVKIADVLNHEGDDTQTEHDKKLCSDFGYFQHYISKTEQRIVDAGLPGRLPKDANLTVVLPKTPAPTKQFLHHGYDITDDVEGRDDWNDYLDALEEVYMTTGDFYREGYDYDVEDGGDELDYDELHAGFDKFRERRNQQRQDGVSSRGRPRPQIPRLSLPRRSTSSAQGYNTPDDLRSPRSASSRSERPRTRSPSPGAAHPGLRGRYDGRGGRAGSGRAFGRAGTGRAFDGRGRGGRGRQPVHRPAPSGTSPYAGPNALSGHRRDTPHRDQHDNDFKFQARRKAKVIQKFCESGQAEPSKAPDTLSRIRTIANEIVELQRLEDLALSEDEAYKTADEHDDHGDHGDVETDEQRDGRRAAAHDDMMHRLQALGMEDEAAKIAASSLKGELISKGHLALGTGNVENFFQADDQETAYVDTCGSKVMVKNPSMCRPGSIRSIRPIKVIMGKGHATAHRMGLVDFVFAPANPGGPRRIITLPALIVDFDDDLTILSGPMINAINILIGPSTNYLVSEPRLHDKYIPLDMPANDDKFIVVEKKNNVMPYVRFTAGDGNYGDCVDFITGEKYDSTVALRRLRDSFPTLLNFVSHDADEIQVINELKYNVNVYLIEEMKQDSMSLSPMLTEFPFGMNDLATSSLTSYFGVQAQENTSSNDDDKYETFYDADAPPDMNDDQIDQQRTGGENGPLHGAKAARKVSFAMPLRAQPLQFRAEMRPGNSLFPRNRSQPSRTTQRSAERAGTFRNTLTGKVLLKLMTRATETAPPSPCDVRLRRLPKHFKGSTDCEFPHAADSSSDTASTALSQGQHARSLRKVMGMTAIYTTFLLCYGLATECDFVARHDETDFIDKLPIQIIGGVESDKYLRTDFETQNPHAQNLSFDDMRTFTTRLENDVGFKDKVKADIWTVTCPCNDNTTLKSLNNIDTHPDGDLFKMQVRAVELARPRIVISEMTSPHERSHSVHKDVLKNFTDIGYDVVVTERMPSDNCGDRTSRQRWIMIARLAGSGPLNMTSFADKGPTKISDVLDEPDNVSDELWVNTSVVPSARGGEHVDQSVDNVGELVTHAKLVGFADGNKSKGHRIYDIDYPIPTITRYGNILIQQDERVRYLSVEEMARASSFSDRQVARLKFLDSIGRTDKALTQIANAVPRGLLFTIYEIAVYDLQRSDDISGKTDTNVSFHVTDEPFVDQSPSQHALEPQLDDFLRAHADFIENKFYQINDDGTITDPDAVATEPEVIPSEDAPPSLRTSRPPAAPTDDVPRYSPGTAEYAAACNRAARYHSITHHTARKMEHNIRHGYGLGCKPGDSQYLKPCQICIRTGLDRFLMPQRTRDVSDRHKYLPGELWFIDGSDSVHYSTWGHKRYCINAVCASSFYRVCFYTTSNKASEFVEFLDYLVKFTKLRTGNDVKKLYSDYYSTYMDDTKVTTSRTRDGRAIELEVTPPYLKARNTYAENSIYSNRKAARARLFGLLGAVINKTRVSNTGPYWLFAWEHAVQTHNFSVYDPLTELHGVPTTPLQAFTGNRSARAPVLRAFGEPCVLIQQLDKRPNKLSDTSINCYYLFNGGYNSITNVLADSPQSHVVLTEHGQLRISGKIAFPYETKIYRDAFEATSVPSPTAVQPIVDDVSEARDIGDNNFARPTVMPSTQNPAQDRYLAQPQQNPPPTPSPQRPLATTTASADAHANPISPKAIRATRNPAPVHDDPSPAHDGASQTPQAPTTPLTPSFSIPRTGRAAATAAPAPTTAAATPLPAPLSMLPRRLSMGVRPVVPTPPALTAPATTAETPVSQPEKPVTAPVSGAVDAPRRIPPWNILRTRDDQLVWDSTKTKAVGTKSGTRFELYRNASTTAEYARRHPGPPSLARADFEWEFKRGFFTMPQYPGLDLLHTVVPTSDPSSARGGEHDVSPSRPSTQISPSRSSANRWTAPNACRQPGDWPLFTSYAQSYTRDSLTEQRLLSVLDELHGDTLGMETTEYRDIRTGKGHYDYKRYATDFGLFTFEAVRDHLMFYSDDYDEIVLQIVDSEGDDVPIVDAKDIRLDQFKLADLKNVPQEQRQPMMDAIAKEVEGLCNNGVFEFVPGTPPKKPLNSRLVLKIKYRADGTYDKHKGRMVVKGFQAVPGIDFFSTFSPMGTLTTVRMIFAIAVAMDLDILHVDVPQAFIQAKIDTPIYVQLPNGITVDARYQDGRYDNRVVRLLRALYGLKQSPQLWNKELNRVICEKLGFTRACSDSCLYFFEDKESKLFVLLVAEVDDLVITGNHVDKIAEIKDEFTQRYKITAWEHINSFLGLRIDYDRKAGKLTMDVKAKVDELFVKHPELNDCQPRSVPLTDNIAKNALSLTDADRKLNKVDRYLQDKYSSIVGALIYMTITVRADLAFAVGRLSRGMHNPTHAHVLQLRHVIGYLKVHRQVPLTYKRTRSQIQELYRKIADSDSALATIIGHDFKAVKDPLVGYTDSDFASGYEKDRRSVSGMAFFLFGSMICWRSKVQPFTAKSTHAAELVALSLGSDEGVWLRRMLVELGFVIPHVARIVPATEHNENNPDISKVQEIGVKLSPPILCDNKGTVFTANNPSTDVNNKALETRWYNVRDYVRDGLLRIFHIGTNLNVADFFTKPLVGEKFFSFRNFIMGDYVKRDEQNYYSYFTRLFGSRKCDVSINPACVRAV